jgi:hypothetical protein
MVAECGLPVAPMAMPEQQLTRQRAGFFAPLVAWLTPARTRS